jgi:hypothetical protein
MSIWEKKVRATDAGSRVEMVARAYAHVGLVDSAGEFVAEYGDEFNALEDAAAKAGVSVESYVVPPKSLWGLSDLSEAYRRRINREVLFGGVLGDQWWKERRVEDYGLSDEDQCRVRGMLIVGGPKAEEFGLNRVKADMDEEEALWSDMYNEAGIYCMRMANETQRDAVNRIRLGGSLRVQFLSPLEYLLIDIIRGYEKNKLLLDYELLFGASIIYTDTKFLGMKGIEELSEVPVASCRGLYWRDKEVCDCNPHFFRQSEKALEKNFGGNLFIGVRFAVERI